LPEEFAISKEGQKMAEKKKPAAKKPAAKKSSVKKPAAAKSAAKKPAIVKNPAKKPAPKKTAAKPATKASEGNLGNTKSLKNAGSQASFRPTVSHMLGEIVWLMSQSKPHRQISIGDLDKVVAPAIANNQYRVFRANKKPVGVAFWANVSEGVDKRLLAGDGPVRPNEWKSGEKLWLIEVISPFANAQNKLMDAMFADLVNNPFKGKSFRFTKTNPQTGQRQVAEFKPKSEG